MTKLRRDLPKQASEMYNDIIKQTDGEVSEIINMIEQQSQEYQKVQQAHNNTDDRFEKIIESMDFSQINQNYNDHLQLLNETNKNLPSLKIEFEKYNRTVQFLEDAYQEKKRIHIITSPMSEYRKIGSLFSVLARFSLGSVSTIFTAPTKRSI